jgi:excisionase family DNA binding protein
MGMPTVTPDRTHGVFVSQEMDKLKTVRAANYADKWDVPIITYAEAAYYLGVHRGTLRTWVIGRSIPVGVGQTRWIDPLIKAADVQNGLLSFYNLAEAHVLAASRYKHRVPLRSIRNAIIHLQNKYPSPRPLLSKEFYTDGLDMFIKGMTDAENLSRQGQLGFKPILDLFLHRIEFDDKFRPKKIWPLIKGQSESEKVVSMVFGVSSGRPTVDGTGIPVMMLWQRSQAGEDVEELADDYEIDVSKVKKAIEYIEHIKAAA